MSHRTGPMIGCPTAGVTEGRLATCPERSIIQNGWSPSTTFSPREGKNPNVINKRLWVEGLPVLAVLLCFLVPEILCAQVAHRTPDRGTSSAARPYVEQAKQAMDKGQHSRALRLLNRGIARDKKSSVAYKLRGVVLSRMGLHQRAAKDFGKYIERNPSDAAGYLLRGDAENMSLNHRAAVVDYTSAIKLKPTSVAAYMGRGLAYAGLERYTYALKDYQWALKLDPGNVEALTNAGRACMLSGKPFAAMSYLKMALDQERDPQWIRRIKEWMSKLVEDTEKPKKEARGPTRSRSPGPQKPLW